MDLDSPVRETSVACYYEIIDEGLVGEMQQVVYDLLLEGDGLTDQEIVNKLGYKDPNKVRPRRKELLNYKLILDNGIKVCSVTGRKAHSWIINPNPDLNWIRSIKGIKKRKCEHCDGKGYILEFPLNDKQNNTSLKGEDNKEV